MINLTELILALRHRLPRLCLRCGFDAHDDTILIVYRSNHATHAKVVVETSTALAASTATTREGQKSISIHRITRYISLNIIYAVRANYTEYVHYLCMYISHAIYASPCYPSLPTPAKLNFCDVYR